MRDVLKHWTSACRVDPVQILEHLLYTPRDAIRQHNGYVVVANTPLAVPCTLASVETLQSYKAHVALAWHCIADHPRQKLSMFAYVLSLTTCHPHKQQLLRKLQTRIKTLTEQDLCTAQAFRAARVDLQTVVLLGYDTLRRRLKTPHAVQEALEAVCREPWHFPKISPFYQTFVDVCQRAAIAIQTSTIGTTDNKPFAIIDHCIRIFVLEKDKYLLVYLLSFSTDRQTLEGAPAALQHFWNHASTSDGLCGTIPRAFSERSGTTGGKFGHGQSRT